MSNIINTIAFYGINPTLVEVQINISNGIPSFIIVGLPDKAIAESKERIRSAIESSGLSFPLSRLVVNLSPASLPKEGSHYDLPIALSILSAMGVIDKSMLEKYFFLGELSLNGNVNKTSGILASTLYAQSKNMDIMYSYDAEEEASSSKYNKIILVKTLTEVIKYFSHHIPIEYYKQSSIALESTNKSLCMSEVFGNPIAKRGVEIAAAGGHHVLLIGEPGSGKSMISRRIPGIIGPMNSQEINDCTILHNIAGLTNKLVTERPFRNPHHSSSNIAIIGGGKNCLPGEISLSHNGILFLDEFPEFPRSCIEALRQPMEDKTISVSRAINKIVYPANFQLVAAMNHCKCGYFKDPSMQCTAVPKCAKEYIKRISGPILDRIDIYIAMDKMDMGKILNPSNIDNEEKSILILNRIINARDRQKHRYNMLNSCVNLNTILSECSSACIKSMHEMCEKKNISNRGYLRILRVARTIADLDSNDNINQHHIAEAIYYHDFMSSFDLPNNIDYCSILSKKFTNIT